MMASDRYKTVFDDEELVEALVKGLPSAGNLSAFFNSLPRPERERLIREAQKRKREEN